MKFKMEQAQENIPSQLPHPRLKSSSLSVSAQQISIFESYRMYKAQQQSLDLQDNSDFGNPKSWLSAGDDISQSSLGNASAANGNVDRELYNDLVQMVPLVQSLIDRKSRSSFTRRASVIYTKTPSKEALSKKIAEPKGRNATVPTKKKREHGDKEQVKNANNNQDADNFSIFPSRGLVAEKDIQELVALKEQVEDLQRRLLEKDELIESAEFSKNQAKALHAKLDELKHQDAEKDSLIKSTQSQLSDAKIKLADKQAALEKIQWEAMTSNSKVEKLQEEVDSMQGEISSFMLVLEGLTKNDSTKYDGDYDIKPHCFDKIPYIDDLDDSEMQQMEEARRAYMAAVAAVKEKEDEESIAAAANARVLLQSFVFRPQV